jgi:hypothetical protein
MSAAEKVSDQNSNALDSSIGLGALRDWGSWGHGRLVHWFYLSTFIHSHGSASSPVRRFAILGLTLFGNLHWSHSG